MRRIGIIGALAGMLGRLPAQVRENFQLMKMGNVKVLSEAEAKGEAPDPHAAARLFKKLNRKARRRTLAKSAHAAAIEAPALRFKRTGRYDRERPCKALRAAGHTVRVRGH